MRRLLSICLLLVIGCWLATAQVGTGGTILGTVTDPSGAAVPNVAITITNADTNVVTHVTSNGSGEYLAPGLQIGRYTLRAEAPGFKVAEQHDIVLNVGDRRPIDLKLEIGSTQESVNVEATAVAVQSESGEVSDVITGQQVSQLATNGRSIYSLATLTPGASSNMVDFQNPTPVGGRCQRELQRPAPLPQSLHGGRRRRPGSWRIGQYQHHAFHRFHRGVPAAHLQLQRRVRPLFRRDDDSGVQVGH